MRSQKIQSSFDTRRQRHKRRSTSRFPVQRRRRIATKRRNGRIDRQEASQEPWYDGNLRIRKYVRARRVSRIEVELISNPEEVESSRLRPDVGVDQAEEGEEQEEKACRK